jgi:adenylate kinase family enzyme
MNRIMIFGRPGSGKSTFALNLSKRLNLPLYHLDKYYFIENWQERNREEFLQTQQEIVNQEKWIIDGNSVRSLEMRYQRAEIVLYFAYPRLLCLWRLIKRSFKKDTQIEDRAEGCPEKLRWRLITYMWSFEDRVKDSIQLLQANYPHVKFYKITKDADIPRIS